MTGHRPRIGAPLRWLAAQLDVLAACVPAILGCIAAVLLGTRWPDELVAFSAGAGWVALWLGVVISAATLAFVWGRRTAARAAARAARAATSVASKDRRRLLLRLDHELKNPITAMSAALVNVSAALDTAASSKADGLSAAREGLTSIAAQAERLSRLTGDLRKLADLETRALEMTRVDVAELLEEVHAGVFDLPEATTREVVLSVPRAPWPLPPVDGDRDLLYVAIVNLVSNALKFSGPSDTVEIRAVDGGADVVIEVADTGCGVPSDETEMVWEELARGRLARGMSGTGVGLALVRTITARHGGSVELRSREGTGTVVAMRLPVPAGGHETALDVPR